MTLGGRCTNADFKGYRADVAARVWGSVRLDKGQGNFLGFTVLGGQDRVTAFQRSTVFLVGNSRDGQSRPALRQCSYFLTFLRHSSTNRTAEHSASTSKSAGRAASPVCGIRNVGAMVCAGGRGGRRFTGRRLRAYRRGNCAGLQRGQQTVVLKLQHKGRKQRQGKRVFSWVISPILYNSLLNSLFRCVLLYIRHGHNIGPAHGAAVLQRGRCDARPPRPLLR